jgi:hypothetical protein
MRAVNTRKFKRNEALVLPAPALLDRNGDEWLLPHGGAVIV